MKKKVTRKELERQARRELIIDSAIQIMERKGFENATMDEIADAAEVGKGTLYLYFENKTSIYLAICDRGSRLLNMRLSKILIKEDSGLAMIEKMGYAYMEFVSDNPLFFTAFNYVENILDSGKFEDSEWMRRCEAQSQEAMTYIVRALQIGMQDGSIRATVDPRELGLIIWGASKGIIQLAYQKQHQRKQKFLDDVDVSLKSLITNFIELLGSGMRNDQGSN